MEYSFRKFRLEQAPADNALHRCSKVRRLVGKIFNLITFSSSVSYAMDVFGGARRSVESLRAQAEYQRYENVAAYLMLSAMSLIPALRARPTMKKFVLPNNLSS
jgi:hypothetical protein